jgi:hypothetical protein
MQPKDNIWPNFVRIFVTIAEKSDFNGQTPDARRWTTDAKWFHNLKMKSVIWRNFEGI